MDGGRKGEHWHKGCVSGQLMDAKVHQFTSSPESAEKCTASTRDRIIIMIIRFHYDDYDKYTWLGEPKEQRSHFSLIGHLIRRSAGEVMADGERERERVWGGHRTTGRKLLDDGGWRVLVGVGKCCSVFCPTARKQRVLQMTR